MAEWIGVDLDGTLAEYNYGDLYRNGNTYIGQPVPLMLERIKRWRAEGVEVRIFTARVSEEHPGDLAKIRDAIEAWCLEHIGEVLPITNVKDYSMMELWDDRSVQVIPNTGISIRQLAQENLEHDDFTDSTITTTTKPDHPKHKRSCNRHYDCDEADKKARAQGRGWADHCHDDCCEDCFGY